MVYGGYDVRMDGWLGIFVIPEMWLLVIAAAANGIGDGK